jgi:sugar O-acyltransferase (sialic acid O-acetyltransferase NeuD family)
MTRLIVIGAGGHAKVVVDAALRRGLEIAAVIDEAGGGGEVLGYRSVTDFEAGDGDGFVVAIGDNATRQDRFDHYRARGWTPLAVVHPDAILSDDVIVEPGAVVFAGVIVNSCAHVGEDAILNTGCTVDHDCVIGAHAHVGPGANMCGDVTVGEGALLGVGSCVVPGASVGSWATVGAGAAVVRHVADGTAVVGVPARELRRTGEPS